MRLKDQTDGLPMFEGTGPLLVKAIAAHQEVRRRALAKIEPQLRGTRGRIYAWLLEYGPLDRRQIGLSLGIPENSVNGRVAELIKMGKARINGLNNGGDRGMVEAIR
jgi:hypothetical protein